MWKRKRKGVEPVSTLGGLVIVSVLLLLTVIIGGRIYNYLTEAGSWEVCQTSLKLRYDLKDKLPRDALPSIKCDRREFLLSYNDVVERGKIDKDESSKLVAEEMARCWKYYGGEGRIDPFLGEKEETYCLICSQIIFDDRLRRHMEGQYLKFPLNLDEIVPSPLPWMDQHIVPGTEQTYTEYLYKGKINIANIADLQSKQPPLKDGSTIIVLMNKREDEFSLSPLGKALAVGAVVTGVIATAVVVIVGLPAGLVGAAVILSIGAGLAGAGILTFQSAGADVGAAMVPAFVNGFVDCTDPTCKTAVGGLALIPPEIKTWMRFRTEAGGETFEMTLCDHVMN